MNKRGNDEVGKKENERDRMGEEGRKKREE